MSKGFTNAEQVKAKLRTMASKMPDVVAAALYKEASVEATEVKRRTPVDRGNLRGSIIVTKPEREGNQISCRIVAGGTAAPYALYVHENLDAHHPVGQAKFIESTLYESRPYLPSRIAKRIDLGKLL